MAKRECLPVHIVPPSLISQLWLSWFIDSFYVRVFLADPYKSSGDIGGWDGLDCAFCNRPGISENSWVPHWKGIWQAIPPPNQEFESHNETPNNRWIPKQSGDSKCWAILPLPDKKKKSGQTKRSKASGMRAFSVRSLSHKWNCLRRSGCKDNKRRAEGLTKMHCTFHFYLIH